MTLPVVKSRPPLGGTLIEQLIREVLNRLADEVLREALLRVLRPAALASAEATARSLGLRPSVDAGHPLLARLVSDRSPKLEGVNELTRQAVRRALLAVVSDGGSLEDQQAAIRQVFAQASRHRAQTIARTEAGTFWHTAGQVQAAEAGARSHLWLATRDSRVREAHAAADGQCQSVGIPYIVDGEPLLHPHDPNGSPGNIINCRCTEIFQVTPCEARALTYGQRTWLWKAARRVIAPWERATVVALRRQLGAQRDAMLVQLQRSGAA